MRFNGFYCLESFRFHSLQLVSKEARTECLILVRVSHLEKLDSYLGAAGKF